LLGAVAEDEGFALLSGEPGTGKTLLAYCLLQRLGPEVTSAFLTNSHFGTRAGLLQAILYDLSLPYENRSEQELRLALTDVLLKQVAAGKRTLLVVDEAQHLSTDLLEELRLLGNLEAGPGKALQVILLGQPGLLRTLRQPELAALSQRLIVRARIEPLGMEEAIDYLLHVLRVAGGRPEEILDGEAMEVLARATRGVPRLLNQAAHQSLVVADAADVSFVDVEIVLEALANLGIDVEPEGPDGDPPPGREGEDEDAELGEFAGERSRRLFAPPRQPA
jgi:type II secretory pathway predicted ATPase ExeA